MKYLIAKIKDIINNPRLLVKATMYLVVVSIGVDVLECFKYFSYDNIFEFIVEIVFTGSLATLIYFLLINYHKVRNINVLNNILFFNYFIAIIINLFFEFSLVSFISTYISLYIGIVIFLGLIFYSKNNKFLKPNILTDVCIILYILYVAARIYSLVNIYHINDFKIVLQIIISNIYLVPMVLYFRLYTFNKLKKKEEK